MVRYIRSGFGSFFHSEFLPGALPKNQNSPQKAPYGLYAELLSGTAFTAPRHSNRYSWLYRVRPSVAHQPQTFKPFKTVSNFSQPTLVSQLPPEQLRFRKPAGFGQSGPHSANGSECDFIDGLHVVAVNGSGQLQDGAAAGVYSFNRSTGRVFRNNDAEMLFLPCVGDLLVQTELGKLEVSPMEFVLIPRGIAFRINPANEGVATSGYVLENFGSLFQLPELGPIGISSGLAHARHFEAPEAWVDESRSSGHTTSSDPTTELVVKYQDNIFSGQIHSSPFDVAAWYGNYVPLKYDMRLFMAVNTVTFDHPDPSIGCVLQSAGPSPVVSNIDFVIFPPRWMVAENTLRTPWFHRNFMSEFMGIIRGEYDAKKGGGFSVGASSVHNKLLPHGPDYDACKHSEDINTGDHQRYSNTLAFMWESNKVWTPTEFAWTQLRDEKYSECWRSLGDAAIEFPIGRVATEAELREAQERANRLPFNPDQPIIF